VRVRGRVRWVVRGKVSWRVTVMVRVEVIER